MCRVKIDIFRKHCSNQSVYTGCPILDAIARIKERQDALRRTTRHVVTRVAECIDVDGGIFERLLQTVPTFVT